MATRPFLNNRLKFDTWNPTVQAKHLQSPPYFTVKQVKIVAT